MFSFLNSGWVKIAGIILIVILLAAVIGYFTEGWKEIVNLILQFIGNLINVPEGEMFQIPTT